MWSGLRYLMRCFRRKLTGKVKSSNWQLLVINSEYKVASDNVNKQIDTINKVIDKYDSKGMLIGEAPCTKDLISITDKDFKVVNSLSILAIFLIIALTLNPYHCR